MELPNPLTLLPNELLYSIRTISYTLLLLSVTLKEMFERVFAMMFGLMSILEDV